MNKKQLLWLDGLYNFGLGVLEGELKKRKEDKMTCSLLEDENPITEDTYCYRENCPKERKD